MTNSPITPPTAFEATENPDAAQNLASLGLGEDDVAGEATPNKMSKSTKRKISLLMVLLLILAALFVWYLLNRKPLSELPGLSSTTLPHYEMSIYGANKPLGVAVTPTGDRIYVTESDGPRLVRVYDSAGKQTGTLTPPSSTGLKHLPMYVAINPKTQDVYVSDRLTSSIYIYNSKNKYVRTFAPKGDLGGKFAPMALTFTPDGSLYVTDVTGSTPTTHKVLAFDPDGKVVRAIGAGTLNFPNGIVVDASGNVNVADSNNGRFVIFSKYGKALAAITPGLGEGDLGMPRGAAIDDAGRLFVVDTADHMVRAYTIDKAKAMPTYFGSFGGEGQLDGTFEFPNGLATDTRAHLYITDRENNRVQVWGY